MDPKGALTGVRVLDLAVLPAGQYCGRILADLGAAILKVEAGPDGDPLRGISARDPRQQHLFDVLNAGKQSYLVDAADPVIDSKVAGLLADVDVVIVSPEVGTDAPWGVDIVQAQARDPRLIACYLTSFGLSGPLAGRPSGEAIIQALSGTTYMTGEPGGPPYLTGAGLPITLTGMHGALAIGQALLARERSGVGQLIDIAMLDVAFGMDCANNPMVASERGRFQPDPIGRFHYAETIGTYRAREGFVVIEVWGEGPDSTWARLATALGRPDLLDDPDFRDDQARVSQWHRIVPIVEAWLQSFPSDRDAIAALDDARVVAGRILEPHEAVTQPPVVERRVVRRVRGADGRTSRLVATPYRMPLTPTSVGPVPGLGERDVRAWASMAGAGTLPHRTPAWTSEIGDSKGGALAGVTVLELAAAVAGPYAARLFADLGANVIKVERPPSGDMQQIFHPPDMAEGAAFAFTSAGKQSLCVDLATPEGRQIVRDLARHVDVVLENSTPGTMEKLGLGYEALRASNPSLVYCSVSGFGQDGPWRGRRATDPAIQGWAGLASMIGEPDGIPYENAAGYCDTTTATAAAIAATFALLHRSRTGDGQYVEVSLLETVLAADLYAVPAVVASEGRQRPHRSGRMHHLGTAVIIPVGTRYVVVELDGAGDDSSWGRVARLLGHPGLVDDPDFADEASRVAHRGEVLHLLDAWAAQFDGPESAIRSLAAAGVIAAVVLTPWEAARHPQIVARQMIRDVSPSRAGAPFPTVATPGHFSGTPIRVGTTAALGEHNREILRTYLGFAESHLDALEADGVLHAVDMDRARGVAARIPGSDGPRP